MRIKKLNENFAQQHILDFLENSGIIRKCDDSSVTEQGYSCLVHYLLIPDAKHSNPVGLLASLHLWH